MLLFFSFGNHFFILIYIWLCAGYALCCTFQGSNFDDEEKKTTGGRNGYGAKLANIFSKKFMVECLDTNHGLKFTQVWWNNMHNADEPVVDIISSSEKKRGDSVKITFVVSNN
jgi:DNA gyrase/topoisomerase IV subunit B